MTTVTDLAEGELIYRYQVPVDDEWHVHELWGHPLFVACREPTVVEFWARSGSGNPSFAALRSFLIVGTGHRIPENTRYWGTAIAPGGHLVWHLLERRS